MRLNPCFSGCWSRTTPEELAAASPAEKEAARVLILVLVDVGLGPAIKIEGGWNKTTHVLILVLVDVGLGHEAREVVAAPCVS